MVRFIKVCIMVCACSVAVLGQLSETEQSWNKPVEPFRIIGNVYYVGASDLTSYLIATPKGHILIDSGMAETVPQVRVNIEKLGFKLSDIKYLLNSHAHYDHAGGLDPGARHLRLHPVGDGAARGQGHAQGRVADLDDLLRR